MPMDWGLARDYAARDGQLGEMPMTEAEWLAATDPRPMLEYLWGKGNDRKLRLFACGCCRQVWKDLIPQAIRRAVEVAEHYADGSANLAKVRQAHRQGARAAAEQGLWNFRRVTADNAYAAKLRRLRFAMTTAYPGPIQLRSLNGLGADAAQQAVSAELLRCVVGNPFYPTPALKPPMRVWNNATVLNLAQSAYEDRELPTGGLRPVRLAMLADALEDAGCTDTDLLGHLRGPGPHVRGCWVVDLVLGKS
jgi:hypothetical protein